MIRLLQLFIILGLLSACGGPSILSEREAGDLIFKALLLNLNEAPLNFKGSKIEVDNSEPGYASAYGKILLDTQVDTYEEYKRLKIPSGKIFTFIKKIHSKGDTISCDVKGVFSIRSGDGQWQLSKPPKYNVSSAEIGMHISSFDGAYDIDTDQGKHVADLVISQDKIAAEFNAINKRYGKVVRCYNEWVVERNWSSSGGTMDFSELYPNIDRSTLEGLKIRNSEINPIGISLYRSRVLEVIKPIMDNDMASMKDQQKRLQSKADELAEKLKNL
jgi:hypothetical protein